MRKDALRFLDSSLCVRKGTVGHIRLKVPVSRLRSEPWSIEIDQVYVIIAPQRHEDYDEIQDNAVQQEIKLSALGKFCFEYAKKKIQWQKMTLNFKYYSTVFNCRTIWKYRTT